jgi:hypothetical protein
LFTWRVFRSWPRNSATTAATDSSSSYFGLSHVVYNRHVRQRNTAHISRFTPVPRPPHAAHRGVPPRSHRCMARARRPRHAVDPGTALRGATPTYALHRAEGSGHNRATRRRGAHTHTSAPRQRHLLTARQHHLRGGSDVRIRTHITRARPLPFMSTLRVSLERVRSLIATHGRIDDRDTTILCLRCWDATTHSVRVEEGGRGVTLTPAPPTHIQTLPPLRRNLREAERVHMSRVPPQ